MDREEYFYRRRRYLSGPPPGRPHQPKRPDVKKRESEQPQGGQPDAGQPEVEKPETGQPENAGQPRGEKPDIGQPEKAGHSQDKKPEVGQPNTGTRQHLVDQYRKLLLRRRYSHNTIKTYTCYFGQFLERFSDRDPECITRDEVNDYILDLIETQNMSISQQNQRINAIKFYFEKYLGRDKNYYYLERPRKEKKLPTVLSPVEVRRLFDCTRNLKHKCILMTIYSGGLRRSELINLQVPDIDPSLKLIKVRNAKGKKDRYTILSDTLLVHLCEYFRHYSPVTWLFEGQGGTQYSATSIQKILSSAARRAGILKHISPHSLRHSFATHLCEQGISLAYVQYLLGHESPNTTIIYTEISNLQLNRITSPLDNLDNIPEKAGNILDYRFFK